MDQGLEKARRGSKLVCVVDDDFAVLASYCALLESAGFTPIPYSSGSMLLSDGRYLQAGSVVLDLRMPPPDGMETLRRLRETPGAPQVIMVTGEGDVPSAVEAMKLGAFDFAEKPIDDDELIGLVARAADTPIAAGFDERNLSAEGVECIQELTPRERQVLKCLIEGATNKEIARHLGISHRTVETYRANIMEKSHAESFSALIRMAVGCWEYIV